MNNNLCARRNAKWKSPIAKKSYTQTARPKVYTVTLKEESSEETSNSRTLNDTMDFSFAHNPREELPKVADSFIIIFLFSQKQHFCLHRNHSKVSRALHHYLSNTLLLSQSLLCKRYCSDSYYLVLLLTT